MKDYFSYFHILDVSCILVFVRFVVSHELSQNHKETGRNHDMSFSTCRLFTKYLDIKISKDIFSYL